MLQDILDIIIKHKEGFLKGLIVTFEICLIVWIVGLLLGTAIGYFISRNKVINRTIKTLSFLLSGVPVLVFLFWLHYPAQSFFNISIAPFYTAVFMLSVLNIIAVSEIVSNGITNLPNQYLEVAKVCGISPKTTFFKIQLPLIARHIVPSLLTAQVNSLHLSLFASLISVEEIFRVSQRIISIEYKPVEIYTALGIFFLIVSLPVNGFAIYLKQKFGRRLDER
ncbi:MAG TPA: ABC transporter permease subunit [Chitinophagales bacterium]|nr:ABC transporter permease subunit [Chitinophagales bacterium]HMY41852.1 ABC transporter permease subunit [Chitinophagales bacterium]HNB39493.1 ABC transporter permease subunit [Chitinophagales bacterium]HNJ02431.1 ABC transporter permease subunit [Chitinophagales bacterium]HNN27053.1 ABC transporter permease subunit [Chitinophagales bacterium]